MSKERSWEEFGSRLDSNYLSANKVFWQTIRRLHWKSLSLWREYFENLLNPIRAASTDTCNAIYFGKEEIFTLTEVAAAIRGLKFGKAAGEDEIRSEMLKALNEEGVR